MGRDYTLDCGVGTMVQIVVWCQNNSPDFEWFCDNGSDCGVVF